MSRSACSPPCVSIGVITITLPASLAAEEANASSSDGPQNSLNPTITSKPVPRARRAARSIEAAWNGSLADVRGQALMRASRSR